LPSHAVAGAPVSVRYFYGIPRTATYKSRVLDAKEDFVISEHQTGDAEQRRRFMLAAGQIGSYLEAGIYDQAFLMQPGHSISTVTALNAANEQGIPIYTIDQSNVAMLSRLQTDPADIEDMRNAINAGLRVTTPQRDITVDDYVGLGYILEDPITGAAAYQISGGRSGGDSSVSNNIYPLPQIPATGAHGFLIGAAQRSQPAAGVLPIVVGATAIEGVEIGVGIGAALVPKILAVIALLLLLSRLLQDSLDKTYPREDIRIRHYTGNRFLLNEVLTYHTIWGTNSEGSFGPGVYFTDADAEYPVPVDSLNAERIGCPVTLDQNESIKHYLEMGDLWFDGTPRIIDAWVEFHLDRKPPGLDGPHQNGSSGGEWVFRGPVMPKPGTNGFSAPVFVFSVFDIDGLCP
jgi:hypothetical protein